jgi:hypothetical protein
MIKVGGESFSEVLAQYAHKKHWRALQHKDCSETKNPLGQATCECKLHFIGDGDVPTPPASQDLYRVLYTHMHYNPAYLKKYMVPGAVQLVIVRDPLAVLRSAHIMAASQYVEEPWIRNSFCQEIASDADVWRRNCSFVTDGRDSILGYLDPQAQIQLNEIVAKMKHLKDSLAESHVQYTAQLMSVSDQQQQGKAALSHFADEHAELHRQAVSVIDKVAQMLESEFAVGIQEDYDASMLLFENVIGWDRPDALYYTHDINSHKKNVTLPEARKAADSWQLASPGREKLLEELGQGIYLYYDMLYKKAVAIHKKQLQARLGDSSEVETAVKLYREQNDRFSRCIDGFAHYLGNSCDLRGIKRYTSLRPFCGSKARFPQYYAK